MGTLYQVDGAAGDALLGKTSVSEFYQVMGDFIAPDTPSLAIYDAMSRWAFWIEEQEHGLGTFFSGDFCATSDSDDPWVVFHKPDTVPALAAAWMNYPVEALRGALRDQGKEHMLQDVDTHSDVGTFLETAARNGAGIIILYNP